MSRKQECINPMISLSRHASAGWHLLSPCVSSGDASLRWNDGTYDEYTKLP
ncbi:MAG TPA: hypothetical protein PL188_09180 [Candidatus Cloacimonadota bacterium]|nr:hypothetical protein [Candidatus Cloacimonadota bacterium]